MELGSILNPQTPPIVPAEAARTSPLGPGGGAGIMDFLKRPEMAAFMAQMGASLIAGRGAKALADGGSAVGRYSVGQMQAKKEQEDRDRKIYESDREYELRVRALEGRGGGGGGGGGGSGGGDGDSDITVAGMKPEAIAKQLYADDLKEWQTAKENEELSGVPAGPRPDPLAYRYRSDVIKKAIASGVTMEQLKQVELDFNNQRAAATAPGSGAPSEGPVGAGPATATPTTPAAPIDPTSGRPLTDVSPFGDLFQYGGGP